MHLNIISDFVAENLQLCISSRLNGGPQIRIQFSVSIRWRFDSETLNGVGMVAVIDLHMQT